MVNIIKLSRSRAMRDKQYLNTILSMRGFNDTPYDEVQPSIL